MNETELNKSFRELGSMVEDTYKCLNNLKRDIGYWGSKSLDKDEVMLLIHICTQQRSKYDIKDSEISLIENYKCFGREYVHLNLIIRFNNGVEGIFFINYNPRWLENLNGDLSELIFILKTYEFFSGNSTNKYITLLEKYIKKNQ